jgi:hypothetical protein
MTIFSSLTPKQHDKKKKEKRKKKKEKRKKKEETKRTVIRITKLLK